MEIDNWKEDDDRVDVYDTVSYFLKHLARLSDYVEETELLSDQVKDILYDNEDDKLGRIRDLYSEEIKRISLWVEDRHDVDAHAKYIFESAKE